MTTEKYLPPGWFLSRNVRTAAQLCDLEPLSATVFSGTNNLDETFSELRDIMAASLVPGPAGNLSPSQASIIIRCPTNDAMPLIDRLLLHLTKALEANLVSMDLEDLEDLGWEFNRQDRRMTDLEGGEETISNSEKEAPYLAAHSSLAWMALHYFGVHYRWRGDDRVRNSKAITAVLDAHGGASETPLLLHFRKVIEFWRDCGRPFINDGHPDRESP